MNRKIADHLFEEFCELIINKSMTFPEFREYITSEAFALQMASHYTEEMWSVRWHILRFIRANLTPLWAMRFVCIGELGTRSSVPELQKCVERLLDAPIAYHTAVSLRNQFRKEEGISEDCRTYRTQRCRDMRRKDYNCDG